MSLLTNLVSYWKLDEASGDAIDAHGSNDLTDVNGVGTGTGIINGARDFERDSLQYLTIASNSDLSIASISVDYEFSCWVNLETNSTNKQIITKRTTQLVGASLEYMLRIDGGTPVVYWGDPVNFNSVGDATGALSTGTWYFFTFGYTTATSRFFITRNAAAETFSVVTTNQQVAGSNPFGIGGNNFGTANEDMDGLIDEVGFWKGRILTADERTELYNGGAGLSYDNFGGGSGSVSNSGYLGLFGVSG